VVPGAFGCELRSRSPQWPKGSLLFDPRASGSGSTTRIF
jgi:hypothetical protein